ncbi:MAG TPA: ABC transporter permease subunit [Caulobacteraceae bacterium]|jgi:NitT/TauT family transport system permease protein|nr:ABC transporter permease subunit [Caulobacteraceae bacterium]
MVFLTEDRRGAPPLARFLPQGAAPNRADLIAFVLLIALVILVGHGATQMAQPLSKLTMEPVSLDPARLPEYALRTTLRMFLALGVSLLFTFVTATFAAKSKKAEMVIVPALDILQSVPVLGFLTFTYAFFLGLFPGSQMGAEVAAIFLIFTSQAWNMTFSFYQSLKTIPNDLSEVSQQFALSPWRRFIRLELPFATPALVWNIMMSMSGAWFFVVVSEAFTVGHTTINLPGIGSYIMIAEERQDMGAVAMAVGAMALVILAYDQLFFRPIVAWADKFRFEQTASEEQPSSWLYDLIRRTRAVRLLFTPLSWPAKLMSSVDWKRAPKAPPLHIGPRTSKAIDAAWLALLLGAVAVSVWLIGDFIMRTLSLGDVFGAFGLGLLTLIRVVVLVVIASIVWVPIGIWIGMNPRWAERLQPIAQFLAAFPANVLFPFAVLVIAGAHLNPDIWLSPLMILGAQWYILFNVIAGASSLPTDLKDAARLFKVRSWQWWRRFALPGIFPYYVTGALTASGGAWNAAIVAEVVNWGGAKVEAKGLGSYIADASAIGDYHRVALGVAVMSVFVVLFNRTVWRPLFQFGERRLRLD